MVGRGENLSLGLLFYLIIVKLDLGNIKRVW